MEKTSIKKNFVLNMILSISGIIFPLITYPYVGNILGPNGTGAVDFTSSAISYFALFAQLGIPTYGIRACARVRDDKIALSRTVRELFTINMFMTIIVYSLLIPAIFIVPYFSEDKALFFVMGSSIFFNTIGMEYLFKAIEQYKYITIRSLIFKIIAMVMMFFFVKTENDYVIYGAITIIASSASNILNFWYSRKFITIKAIGKCDYKRHMIPVLSFFALACTISIYVNLDSVMLRVMTTKADVGCYGASIKIKSLLVTLITSLGAVLLPRLSYYTEHKMINEFTRMTQKALRFVLVVSVPLLVYFMVFSQESILVANGANIEYLPAVPAMRVILPTLLFIGITNIIGIQVFVPLGKERFVIYSTAAGAIVDFLLNILLIPKYQIVGASIGTLAAEFTVLIIQIILLAKLNADVPVIQSFKRISYWKILFATSIGIVSSLWIKLLHISFFPDRVFINNFLILCVSSLAFLGSYGITMLLLKDEIVTEIVSTIYSKLNRKNI